MFDRKAPQTRTIPTTSPTKFRAAGTDKPKIEGYFAVFGSKYELWPGATESIDPHAFDDTLHDDIRALVDHETRLVLGRSKAGTFALRTDSRGLWGSVSINDKDTDATNAYARVERGDVTQGSFGFDILDEQTDIKADGSVHWTIKKVKLYECSLVTFPAYVDTGLTARKAQYEQIRKQQREKAAQPASKKSLLEWKAEMRRRIKGSSARIGQRNQSGAK